MTIEFKREILQSKYLDPTRNFEENALALEIRTDPLTKRTSIVFGFRYRKAGKSDLSGLIEKSLEMGCPFCPESIDKATPKFPPELIPEGRIHLGEACVFPNLMPYAPYSALASLSSQHFIGLPDFTMEILVNGFLAAQTYLKRVLDYDHNAKYCSISWNHMLLSGASMVHPHIQIMAAYHPFTYQDELLKASKRYYEQNSTNFWPDFIAKEKELGERYIGTIGNTSWFTSFVARAWLLDVMAIFQQRDSILNLSRQDFVDFFNGLEKVFNYMSDENFYAFNLSIYSGVNEQDHFWTHARIIPRYTLPPMDSADAHFFQLLNDQLASIKPPEVACTELKKYFQ